MASYCETRRSTRERPVTSTGSQSTIYVSYSRKAVFKRKAARHLLRPTFTLVCAPACLCLFFLLPSLALAAEPDWSQIEKHALEFLQRYIRIRSINPPADTTETAALIKTELSATASGPSFMKVDPPARPIWSCGSRVAMHRKSRCCC